MYENTGIGILVIIAVGAILYYVLRLAVENSITSGIKLMADKQLEELKSELLSKIESISFAKSCTL